MPNIQLLSDLHLEHIVQGTDAKSFDYLKRVFFDHLDPEGVDTLVLAGDITSHWQFLDHLRVFASMYPQVVYVTGNHEYYGAVAPEMHATFKQYTDTISNLTFLDNEMVEVGGVKFVGGTLWFPKPDPVTYIYGKRGMNDYRIIREFEPWVYEQHAKCVGAIETHIGEADVVVTHHLPAHVCTAPQFRGSPLDHFFCHDMTEFILEHQPPLWLYGHTHVCGEQQIGETRLVANPKGYPTEHYPVKYNKKLVIEIHGFTPDDSA